MVNAIGTNTVKSVQIFSLIVKNLERHKTPFKIIAKDEKNFYVIWELIKKLDLNKNLFSENLNVSKNEIIQY